VPSVSKKQHNLMMAVAHSPKFAKKVGIPQSVGMDFAEADKGKKFGKGGAPAGIAKQKTHHGVGQLPNAMLNKYIGHKEGGMMKHDDVAQDKAMIKKAMKQHDTQQHKGSKGTTLKLSKGGSFRAAADGITKTGKTKGTMIKMCSGGMKGYK